MSATNYPQNLRYEQIATAPAAVIGHAVPAERPRAGEPTIRLGDMLAGKARENAGLYSFLYFMRAATKGKTFYASPDALVHADAVLRTDTRSDGSVCVMALPKVCGGSGEGDDDNASAADASACDDAWYPETVPMHDDLDGFEAAGLGIVHMVGVDDEYESATHDECARAAEAHAKECGGTVYTQVDAESGGIEYVRGLARVNRTGVYAVVKTARLRPAGDTRDGMADVFERTEPVMSDAEPSEEARLVAEAMRLFKEARHDATTGGATDEVLKLLRKSAECMRKAAGGYKYRAIAATNASWALQQLWTSVASSLAGNCPVRNHIHAGLPVEDYIPEWYDLSGEEQDNLFEAGESTEWYTEEYQRALRHHQQEIDTHDETCNHRACVAARFGAKAKGREKEGGS